MVVCFICEKRADFYSRARWGGGHRRVEHRDDVLGLEGARARGHEHQGVMAELCDQLARSGTLCIGLAACVSVQVVKADGGVRGVGV